MSLYVVPTFSDPSWHQSTTFEGSLYGLQFDYNQRGACWYMSIADADGVDIYNGVKLVTGFPLLRKCADVRRPPGEFFLLSSTADQSPPGLLDLLPGSGRCELLYVSSDWVAILFAGGLDGLVSQLTAGGVTTVSPVSTYGQS